MSEETPPENIHSIDEKVSTRVSVKDGGFTKQEFLDFTKRSDKFIDLFFDTAFYIEGSFLKSLIFRRMKNVIDAHFFEGYLEHATALEVHTNDSPLWAKIVQRIGSKCDDELRSEFNSEKLHPIIQSDDKMVAIEVELKIWRESQERVQKLQARAQKFFKSVGDLKGATLYTAHLSFSLNYFSQKLPDYLTAEQKAMGEMALVIEDLHKWVKDYLKLAEKKGFSAEESKGP